MSKSTLAIIIYIAGLIFGALVLDLWSAETGPKAFIGIGWTAYGVQKQGPKPSLVLVGQPFYLLPYSMLISMKKNSLQTKIIYFLFFFIGIQSVSISEIMHLTGCKNLKDGFIKNEYILNFEKSLMIRNYIYDNKTFKKYKSTDLSVKQEGSVERFIYEESDLIYTDKIGYPQFYTQLMFKKDSPIINIKTVINGEEGISKISTCKKVEVFVKES